MEFLVLWVFRLLLFIAGILVGCIISTAVYINGVDREYKERVFKNEY